MSANKSENVNVMLDATLMNTQKNIPKPASTSYRDNNITNLKKKKKFLLSILQTARGNWRISGSLKSLC